MDDLEEEPEFWTEEVLADVFSDFNSDVPLPDPQISRHPVISKLTSLLQWFALFILLWQTNCKTSDNGIEWLLRFNLQFLHLIGVTCNCQYLVQLCTMFPTSLFVVRKLVHFDRDDFTKCVVCPKCSTLYNPDNCTEYIGGKVVIKCCTNKQFKKGKAAKECGTKLAKKVILADGREHFYPLKVYCFNSVINQLESLLKRPGIAEKCEEWRDRSAQQGVYSDIYDGNVWKDFLKYNGKDFLNLPRSLGFALKVDWFQPFKRRSDVSVGVIYLALLNLPREERFRWENIILVGIIPDMETMPKSINSFLQPMVDEMQALWKGVRLHSAHSFIPLVYRAAILLAASDIPAARKLCGFKGHSAERACSKCFKLFLGSVRKGRDFSGFDTENWPPRTNRSHRRHAEKIRSALNKSSFQKLGKNYGCYYSVLLKLEYFDAVRFTVIDPMHNLFLGTAKRMFKLWVDQELLTKKKLKILEDRINSLDVGKGFGRLPHKITSNHGRYKACQWKNWVTVYSTYALHDLLPEKHLNCWHSFVMACRFLTVPVISTIDLGKADMLLLKFCREFENLYGKKGVRINMHLHGHLKECIEDYGPIYSFWCIAFERYNGILGSFKTNNRSVEIQLMRKFMSSKYAWNVSLPKDFSEHFSSFFHDYDQSQVIENLPVGSSTLLSIATSLELCGIKWIDIACIQLPSAFKLLHFDPDDRRMLLRTYQLMYPETDININMVSEVARRYTSVILAGQKLGSKLDCRSLRSARLMASWAGNDGVINPKAAIRPCEVKFYLSNTLKTTSGSQLHVFACLKWYSEDSQKEFYRRPVQIWSRHGFDSPGPATFMPVQRVYCKFAAAEVKHDGCQKLVVSPILRTFC